MIGGTIKRKLIYTAVWLHIDEVWGISAVGSASHWQCGVTGAAPVYSNVD